MFRRICWGLVAAGSTMACSGEDAADRSSDAIESGSENETPDIRADDSVADQTPASSESAGANDGDDMGAEDPGSESDANDVATDVIIPAAGEAEAAMVVFDCDTPSVGLGACWTLDSCSEGADEFNAAVLMSICIPGLGLTPTEESCSAFQLLGRCYDPEGGSWEHSYHGYMRPTAAELEQQCLAVEGGVWCTGPLGVPDAISRECRRACDDARPDYTDEPECLDADTCFYDCLNAVDAEGGCAECVTARIQWPAGSCGDFECTCPPATFDG